MHLRALSGRAVLLVTTLAPLVGQECSAFPVSPVKTAVINGVKLVVRRGDEVVCTVDDVSKVSGLVLREALDGVTDVGVFSSIARSRFPAQVGERAIYRLESVAGDLAKVPGAKDVMRLLLATDSANVKGALGELELAAFLLRRKGVVVTGMREVVETGLGKTDIDIAFAYRGTPVILERKAIDGLGLTNELRLKIDKMAEIGQARSAVPILSAGEIPPTGALLNYAASKGVAVTYGGYLNQCRMVQEVLEAEALIAR